VLLGISFIGGLPAFLVSALVVLVHIGPQIKNRFKQAILLR